MESNERNVGDVVEHKVMNGKFVICDDYKHRAGYGSYVVLRDSSGQMIKDVDLRELK
jgi:hypothetical protein